MPLSDSDLTGLHARFIVPLAIARILRGEEKLDDVTEYTINDMLGEMEPDAALLCLALCAQPLATHLARLPIAKVAGMSADGIIKEYAPLWLQRHSQQPPDGETLAAALRAAPEYLEELGDLLLVTCGEINDERHAVPAILCDILAGQAYLHKELAEEKIAALAQKEAPAPHPAGNIIPFPRPR